jgi:arylsulfatase A-like enzyme
MPRLVRIAALGAALVAGYLACSQPAPTPNVILVSVDTLRADHMSLYGYERETTPHLEALARDAVVFEAFFNAGGGTLKSHASLFTSLFPKVHGVEPRRALGEAHRTLAEVLRSNGYATAAFTDIVWLRRKYGFAQGFDFYDQQGGNLVRILPEAVRWLSERAEEPFFLFLHTFDVHSSTRRLPYDSPEGFNEVFTAGYDGGFSGCIGGRCASELLSHINRRIGRGRVSLADVFGPEELAYIAGLYDGGVLYVDRELGKLVEALERLGLYDDTLLVVLADHGEEIGDHGRMLHGNPYEEFVRIPLLIKFPRSRHAGRRINALASMVDVMPTLLDALGIPPEAGMQGRSLLSLAETGRPVREYVTSHGDSIRNRRWKLVASRGELFDLANDPAERNNVFDAHPETVAELTKLWREVERKNAEALRARRVSAPRADELSAQEKAQLESLGYGQ